jgi:aspartyl-tRNA(Asn)/glutamyl-tRNA(Gln) amidotransferase subunit A
MLYEATAGHDAHDATSLTEAVTLDASIWDRQDLKGIRVGIPREYFIDGIDPGVRRAIDDAIAKIRDMGAEVIDISLPHTEHGVSVYYTICPAEVASNLARYDGIRYGTLAGGG